MVSLSGSDVVPTQKLRAHWQLVRCQPKRFTRDRFRHAVQLKQNVARPHRRDPMFGLTLAFAHARFWRAGGHRFIGENADPQLAFALHVASKGHTRGFELRVGDPSALECLKPNSPKSILRLREAVPLRLPRWDLRYFTRFGINGITNLPRVQPARLLSEMVAAARRGAALAHAPHPSYKANTCLRSCRNRGWLP